MTFDEWLQRSTKQLEQAGITTGRLDCLVLAEDVTEHDRAQLLAEPNMEISPEQVDSLQKLLSKRAQHTPLAYVRGRVEFYGRNFVLTPSVLVPRPESETIITLLKKLLESPESTNFRAKKLHIADVGTGSGVLGITAKIEFPGAAVDLLDIDITALKTAQTNVDLFTLDISTMQSDLLANAAQDYDVLLCNLPYVPDDYPVNKAARHEPALALFGGPDGLDLYRTLFQQAQNKAYRPLYILTESLPSQHDALTGIATAYNYELIQTDDFIQVFKNCS